MKSLVLFTITLGFVCCVNSDTTTTMCDDKTPLTGITKQQSNEMTDQVNVLLAGPGLIGGALLQQIGAAKAKGVVVIGVANSKSFVVNKDGLDASKAKELLTSSSTSGTVIDFINAGAKLGLKNTVFVDCTASDSVSPAYAHALSLNLHIATANKKVNSDDLDYRKKVLELASQTAGPRFRYETNVGAGLPIIRPLLDAVESGDSVLEIEAILSGTLSYLFNTLSADIPFSQVVSKAKEMGFTEPDPRDDLSGSDVARKIVILARDAGFDVSLSDVKIEGFLPESCVAAKSVPEFLELLKTDCDQLIETRRLEASKNNQCLRYIASLNTTSGSPVMTLALKNIDLSHPAAGIAGSDNICVYRTKRYDSNPMVIKGPGAGAEVTAAGVFGDILSLRDLNVFPKSA